MYQIGEFSKITGLTTQTLRYYDREKILSPSYRNEENGYRYYNAENIKTAQFISLLKKFNFSIMEMKDVLTNMKTQEDFHDFIMEKIALTEKAIQKQQASIADMKTYLALSPLENKEVKNMCYKINLTTLNSQFAASIRFQGKYCEIGDYFAELFTRAGDKVNGVPFTCYYNLEYTETADIEVCIPVLFPISGPNIQTRTFEAVTAISVKHVGAYENLGMVYQALFDHAHRYNLKYFAPIIEFYDKTKGYTLKGNPDKYETRIYLPVNKLRMVLLQSNTVLSVMQTWGVKLAPQNHAVKPANSSVSSASLCRISLTIPASWIRLMPKHFFPASFKDAPT